MRPKPDSRPPPASRPPARAAAEDSAKPAPNDVDVDFEARTTLERLVPELLRKGLEAGRDRLENVGESIFAREITANLASQLGDARSGIVKAVAHEVGTFLRQADVAAEIRKVLNGINVEARVQLKFTARDDDDEAEAGEASRPAARRSRRRKRASEPPPDSAP